MPKLLYAGGRLDSVVQASGVLTEMNNGWYDNAYSDVALNIGGASARLFFSDPASAPLLATYAVGAGHSLFFHMMGHAEGSTAGDALVVFEDSSHFPWFRVTIGGQLQCNTGTGSAPVWTNVGAAAGAISFATNVDIDIKLDIDAGGNLTALLAYNRVAVVGPVTFSAPGLTNIASILLGPTSNTYGASQLLATEDWSTVGGHVKTTRATGAGAHSDWAGTYADVSEVITNDSTVNQANAAGELQTYPMGNITVPAGYVIAGVFQWLRAKNDGNSPANIQSICRPATTDSISGDLPGMLITYVSVGARYDLNPDTSAAWTQAEWNAPVQMGFESAT